MAVITGANPQNTSDSNLNAGMNQPTTGGGPSTGAVTPSGGVAPVSGGAGAATAQARPASSGQFTNFSNYLQANQQAGQRLSNLLAGNIQQQGQAVQNTLQNAGGIQNAVQAENQRISSDLQNVQNAVAATGQGNYGQFNNMLNYAASNAPQAGVGTQPAGPNTNPAYAGLAGNFQQLATGQTQQNALQNQANQLYSQAQNQIAGLQANQALGNTEAGRTQLLQNLIGQGGTYTQGAQLLDQGLLAGSSQNLTNLLNTLGSTTQQAQGNLASTQGNINTALQNLGTAATGAQQQVGTLAQQGLTNLNTSLAAQAAAANTQQQQQQQAILNQFATGNFNQATANQLGLQSGAQLFNVLKNNAQNYGAAPGQFTNTGFLSLNQNPVTQANVINSPELQAYSALQQLAGQSPGQFAYTNTGTVGPAYNVNAKAFDQALANAYANAATSAGGTLSASRNSPNVVLGNAFSTGTTSTATDAIANMVNQQALQNNANYFNQLATGATPTGAFQTVTPSQNIAGPININGNAYNLGDITRSPFVGQLQQAWQNYLNSQGYGNVATVTPS